MNSLFFPTNSRFNTANQCQSFSYSCHLHSSPYSKVCFYPHSSQSPSLRYWVYRILTQSPHCPHQSMRAFLQQIIGFIENKELNYSLKESMASSFWHIVVYSLYQGKVPRATLNCWTCRWQQHWPLREQHCSLLGRVPLQQVCSFLKSTTSYPQHLPLWHEWCPKRFWALLH